MGKRVLINADWYYPAILEAVGEGARTLCPYRNKPEQWNSAVTEVLSNREAWKSRALARAAFLSKRQAQELADLFGFLRGLLA